MSPVLTYSNQEMKPARKRDLCPDYETTVNRSNSNGSRSVHWHSSEESGPTSSTPRHDTNFHRRERYLYTYRLLAGNTPMEFRISVEPSSGTSAPGKYTFRLSTKVNGIERILCEPTILRLAVDPRTLEFAVFVYPGKSSIPAGSLYCLRIWLRVKGVDHRVFADDELWVGKDLDFYSVAQTSIMILKNVEMRSQLYHGYVGRALVSFNCRWKRVNENLYDYSIDYDSNGVGGNLFEDLKLRIDGDPRTVTFLIYSVPINSVPAGSSHRLRIWLKSLVNTPSNDTHSYPVQDSYIYQRVYKNDLFKIGAQLDFESMNPKATMGFAVGPVQTIVTSAPLSPLESSAPPLSPPLSSPTSGHKHSPSTSRNPFADEKIHRGYH